MAEMCDFYKTLSDLAGINPDTVDKGVEGDSLAEAVANPSMQGKLYAFSQTNRVGVASLKAEVPPRHLPNLFSRCLSQPTAILIQVGLVPTVTWNGWGTLRAQTDRHRDEIRGCITACK